MLEVKIFMAHLRAVLELKIRSASDLLMLHSYGEKWVRCWSYQLRSEGSQHLK